MMGEVNNPWEVSNLECFLHYCCPECDFKSRDLTGFEKHAGVNHPRSVSAINRMKKIVQTIQGGKGHHFCNLCGKYFTSLLRLTKHVKRIHKKTKPFQCSSCEMEFSNHGDLMRHIDRIHPDECVDEDKISYDTRSARREQVETEITEETDNPEDANELVVQYRCEPCGAAFFAEAHFDKHNSRVHDFKEFECQQCQTVLKSRNDLKRHMESVHEKKKPFMCTKCQSTFSRKSYGKTHLLVKHKEEDMNLIHGTPRSTEIQKKMPWFGTNIF